MKVISQPQDFPGRVSTYLLISTIAGALLAGFLLLSTVGLLFLRGIRNREEALALGPPAEAAHGAEAA